MGKPRTPKGRVREAVTRLAELYPGTAKDLCELDHETPFQLLTATILSAQSTDKMVNSVTPRLFARYPGPAELADAEPAELEAIVQSTGFFRQKSKALLGMAQRVVDAYGGEVPSPIEDLVTLPGVGRKTANVVRSVALDQPGFPVDTHVGRLVRRLDITQETDPVKVERVVNAMVPPAELGRLSLRLILHGRRVCVARRPRCGDCALADFCPSAGIGAL